MNKIDSVSTQVDVDRELIKKKKSQLFAYLSTVCHVVDFIKIMLITMCIFFDKINSDTFKNININILKILVNSNILPIKKNRFVAI